MDRIRSYLHDIITASFLAVFIVTATVTTISLSPNPTATTIVSANNDNDIQQVLGASSKSFTVRGLVSEVKTIDGYFQFTEPFYSPIKEGVYTHEMIALENNSPLTKIIKISAIPNANIDDVVEISIQINGQNYSVPKDLEIKLQGNTSQTITAVYRFRKTINFDSSITFRFSENI